MEGVGPALAERLVDVQTVLRPVASIYDVVLEVFEGVANFAVFVVESQGDWRPFDMSGFPAIKVGENSSCSTRDDSLALANSRGL